MLINPQWSLTLRCPVCQERMIYRNISRFQLAKGKVHVVQCSCGAEPLKLWLAQKRLYAEIFCPCCEDTHNYIFNLKDLKGDPPFMMGCEDMEVRLACLGDLAVVREAMDEESALIFDYAEELKDYLVKPSIIGHSLLRINQLLTEHSCTCAHCLREDVDILILSDRLVLSCPHCHREFSIDAAKPGDLNLLNKMPSISIGDYDCV